MGVTEQLGRFACGLRERRQRAIGFQVATHVAKGLRPWLFDREVGLAQYTDERVRREDVRSLMQRAHVSVPEELKRHRVPANQAEEAIAAIAKLDALDNVGLSTF